MENSRPNSLEADTTCTGLQPSDLEANTEISKAHYSVPTRILSYGEIQEAKQKAEYYKKYPKRMNFENSLARKHKLQ